MEYQYEVPVVVKAFGSEEEDLLATKKSIVTFVIEHLAHSPWRDFFPNDVIDVKVEGHKDRLLVSIFDDESYSVLNSDIHKEQLQVWCNYGYFEGGLEMIGPYYGYSNDNIVVYLSSHELPIVSKTKISKSNNEH